MDMSPYCPSFWKSVPAPIRNRTPAYWAMKQLNMDLEVAGEKRLLQLNELDEFMMEAYENSKSRWLGLYTVTKVLPYGTIQVNHETKDTFTVNRQRLKHYWGSDFSKQKSTVQLGTPTCNRSGKVELLTRT
ncbi:uncharacterized protein LOC111379579 [Olea europaea var. sylvestris]|uniref:uncharacterized protein LOC111379579 n=1 Tax=Olea europaea var. sylvestris TaxID=158386 RepID=UPI000C1CE024|nr:uncharacterized protein LOC111379579 [Olea europaea var. sylvestris]